MAQDYDPWPSVPDSIVISRTPPQRQDILERGDAVMAEYLTVDFRSKKIKIAQTHDEVRRHGGTYYLGFDKRSGNLSQPALQPLVNAYEGRLWKGVAPGDWRLKDDKYGDTRIVFHRHILRNSNVWSRRWRVPPSPEDRAAIEPIWNEMLRLARAAWGPDAVRYLADW